MSWLSSLTGVHISPKGVKVEPLKLLGDAAMLALPGVGSVAGKALGSIPGMSAVGGALKAIPGVSSIGSLLGGGSAASGAAGASGGGGGLLSSIGGFLTGNHGMNALGLLEGANAAQLGKKSSEFANNAVNQATSDFAAKAPLRVAGIQGLLNPQTQDLSSLTSARNGLNTSTSGLQSIAGLLGPQAAQTSSALNRINARNPFAGGVA